MKFAFFYFLASAVHKWTTVSSSLYKQWQTDSSATVWKMVKRLHLQLLPLTHQRQLAAMQDMGQGTACWELGVLLLSPPKLTAPLCCLWATMWPLAGEAFHLLVTSAGSFICRHHLLPEITRVHLFKF